MSDLAAALGMKRSTLYWYFRDLGQVFDAVMEAHRRRLEAFVRGRLAGRSHPIDVLLELIRAHLDFFEGRHDALIALYQLWAVADADQPGAEIARTRAFVSAVRDQLIDLVAAGVTDGRVRPCDPAQVVDMVLAYCDGSLTQRVKLGLDPHVLVDGFSRYVLEPLRARPEEPTCDTRARR